MIVNDVLGQTFVHVLLRASLSFSHNVSVHKGFITLLCLIRQTTD